MSNNFFRFKQFTVFQNHCAMKVGTDGVLLGAWTEVCGCNNVLDIGTGTGLIALMIAQRNCEAVIDAIDIDEGCAIQAEQNISGSPFAHRINVQHASFQNIAQQGAKNYDLIVSNPPYFQNAFKSPCTSRNTARHNDFLSFFEIISLGVSLISESGRIALILPYEFKQAVLEHAATVNLFASRITNVHPLPHKPAKRLLIELQKSKTDCIEDNLTIELSRHRYSKEFEALTQEFYLER